MYEKAIEEFLKIFSGKNISYLVLLIITILFTYLLYDFTKTILVDNQKFIKHISSVDDKLQKILDILIKKN